jgi:hypothetical protein
MSQEQRAIQNSWLRCHIRGGLCRLQGMHVSTKRVAAAALAVTAAYVGVWALLAPHSFFTSFPLPGRHWISALPAYNEHLTRDVGGLYLALFAASTWCVLRPRAESFRLVGVSWVAFSAPHLAFHAAHLDVFSFEDAAGNVLALAVALLLGVVLLWPETTLTSRQERQERQELQA